MRLLRLCGASATVSAAAGPRRHALFPDREYIARSHSNAAASCNGLLATAVALCGGDPDEGRLELARWLDEGALATQLGYDQWWHKAYAPLLHCALEKGEVGVAGALEEYGASVTTTDVLGGSLLHAAVRSGLAGVVEWVLRRRTKYRGLDVNHRDRDGNTAFLIAVERGDVDTVRLLLADQTVDVAACNNDGDNALVISADCGFADLTRELLRCLRIDATIFTTRHHASPFLCACSQGHLDACKYVMPRHQLVAHVDDTKRRRTWQGNRR